MSSDSEVVPDSNGVEHPAWLRRLGELGMETEPLPLRFHSFGVASRACGLIFTAGQVPFSRHEQIRGSVGVDIDIATARRAARLCAVNSLRSALAVAEPGEILHPVRVLGLVNARAGFDDFTSVINGATELFSEVFAYSPPHARTSVGAILPLGWAVEIEVIFAGRHG